MPIVPIHAGLDLPLSTETSLLVLGVGLLVFLGVVLDIYRREVGGWS